MLARSQQLTPAYLRPQAGKQSQRCYGGRAGPIVLQRQRGAGFFLPAIVPWPCPGQQEAGSWGEPGRDLVFGQTCLVNINRRLEIAHGVGREVKARLCSVPCSSLLFLGAVLPQVGAVQPDLATLSLYQSITIGKDTIQLASQGTAESCAHP